MHFFSDNVAPVHPAVFAAMQAADAVDVGYDGDRLSRALDARFSALFGREAAVLWMPTGTAANAIALAALCPPYGGVICHSEAHIQNDECGAPEFYTHGAKLLIAGGEDARMTPETVRALADAIVDDVHRVQPRALSLTNATELGTVYAPDDVAALASFARQRGWRVHMDGARIANAIVHLGCTPAELTEGVDVLSFGFVKNGGLSTEALVFFDPRLADDARRRRKRGGHLLSKGRYAAAQIHAMLDDDLWLANARAANNAAARLAAAAGARLIHPVEANELFLRMTPAEAASLRALGFGFYDWSDGVIRLVTHWASPAAEVEALTQAIAALP